MKFDQFKAESGRFYLNDPCRFSIRGTIPAGSALWAALDGRAMRISWKDSAARGASEHLAASSLNGAMRVDACVHLPRDLRGYRRLKVYLIQGKTTRLWYCGSIPGLLKFRGKPQFYLEKEEADPESGTFCAEGWAAARTPVKIGLFDENRKPLPFRIARIGRADVKDYFRECAVEEECGFVLEAGEIRGKRVYLVFRDQEGKTAVHPVVTGTLGVLAGRAQNCAKKGVNRIRTQGIRGLLRRNQPVPYSRWLKAHLPDEKELERERNKVFPRMPKISVIADLDHPRTEQFRRMADSVRKQTYRNWELLLTADRNDPVWKEFPEEISGDRRIRLMPGKADRTGRLNAAVSAAGGELLAFLGGADLLEPHALYSLAEACNGDPAPDMIYSDEDRMSFFGREYTAPHMKPDFNPDLLCTTNYISHLLGVTPKLFREAGGFRSGYEGAEEYDLILRCSEKAGTIVHIPKILYHWRYEGGRGGGDQKNRQKNEAGRRAVQDHYDRAGISAIVYDGKYDGLYRARFAIPGEPLVSILIPNKDHREDLKRCITSIEEKSSYRNYEYVIIENNSVEEETFSYYRELEASGLRVRVVRWDGPFNYSDINNYGASFARGEYLLLLNNDTRVINEDWLEELLGYCIRPDVGAVGARLYYEDDTIQHAGVVLGFGGIAGHCFVQQPRENSGYYHRIISPQNYSAVTAACMMVKKKAFDQVGGLSPELAVAFNDIDFCLKLGAAGYRIVYNPYAELYHYESKSRGLEDTPEKKARFIKEISILESRWPGIFSRPDPYYSPNLSLKTQDFSLKEL